MEGADGDNDDDGNGKNNKKQERKKKVERLVREAMTMFEGKKKFT